MSKSEIGKLGEEIAKEYLLKKGHRILEQNYRFGHGEIDIITELGETLVFVEVKTRQNLNFGEPELAVTPGKQNQLRKIGNAYIYEKELVEKECRFDVVAILLRKEKEPKITHYENAF